MGGRIEVCPIWLLVVALIIALIPRTEGQGSHQLKVVSGGANQNTVPAQFTSADALATPAKYSSTTYFASKKMTRICVNGMWALYNQPNFGAGLDDESKVAVISVKGTDLNSCTSPNSITQLPAVMSFYFLGNPTLGMDGINIFSEPSFLGAKWNPTIAMADTMIALPTGMSGVRMGSFAITGSMTKKWRICGDAACDNAICIDPALQTGSFFLVRNTLTDTSAMWPRVVRRIELPTTCPPGDAIPTPQLTKKRRTHASTRNGTDVEVLF